MLKSEGPAKCRFRKEESAASRYRLRKKFTDVVVGWKFYFFDEAPLSSLFEILHLAVGTADRMHLENRPISRAFRGERGCGEGDLERFVGKS